MSASSPMPAPAPTWFRFRSDGTLGDGDLRPPVPFPGAPPAAIATPRDRSRAARLAGCACRGGPVLRRNGSLALELRRAPWVSWRLVGESLLRREFLALPSAPRRRSPAPVTRGALPFLGRVLACRCFLPSRFLPSFFGAMMCRLVVLSIIGPSRCPAHHGVAPRG